MEDDIFYMQKALELAEQAAYDDEVPIGALVVSFEGEILGAAANSGAHGETALAHAEIKAMLQAAQRSGLARLWDCTLYVTLEPCTMCAAAISLMRVKRLVYGAENPKGGAVLNGVKFFEAKTCNHRPEVTGGVLAKECGERLTRFFSSKRK